MCRLAFITKSFPALESWVSQMEVSFGGDGTGLAFGNQLIKKVELKAIDSIKLIKEWPVLWHTRKTSSGFKCDSLCHPFKCDGGYLAHNGHWETGHVAAHGLFDLNRTHIVLSDTAYFSLLVDKLGFGNACERYKPPGVWLHMKGEQVAIWKSSGSLVYSKRLRTFGSEAPRGQNSWMIVDDGFLDYGEKPKLKPVFITNWNFSKLSIDPKTGRILV